MPREGRNARASLQPTHNFPLAHRLDFHFPNCDIASAVLAKVGTAPFSFVSINDAIGDLPHFNWKNPSLSRLSTQKRAEARERAERMPALRRDQMKKHIGFEGFISGTGLHYHHAPRISFHVLLFWNRGHRAAFEAFFFLCGTRQEPSVEEITQILLANPRQFYELANGRENHLFELHNLAVNKQLLGKSTVVRMKRSNILLGSWRVKRSGARSSNHLMRATVTNAPRPRDLPTSRVGPQWDYHESGWTNTDSPEEDDEEDKLLTQLQHREEYARATYTRCGRLMVM
ncbi:hypothetical protein H4582DRAFT_2158125 [Lactarius indigo]|nr:hypothetical protein H4582DRAFT_2158125 [Lactarius indigo]